MPRGPRRNLRPVPLRMSQPIASTSSGSCPADWHASSSSGTPAARVILPTSAAGFTSPLCVGTCTSDTSLTSSSSIDSSASTSICPLSSSGTMSIRAPVRAATCLSAIQFEAYSACAGQDAVARREVERVERHVPCPGRVLDDGDLLAAGVQQPCERVVRVLPVVAALGGGLVAADLGLAREVVDDRLVHLPRRERSARVVEVRRRCGRRASRRGPDRGRSSGQPMYAPTRGEGGEAKTHDDDRREAAVARGAARRGAARRLGESGREAPRRGQAARARARREAVRPGLVRRARPLRAPPRVELRDARPPARTATRSSPGTGRSSGAASSSSRRTSRSSADR